MECNKCKVVVPSEFEFVLSKNLCPKCGNKLMADVAMKVYLDLKKRLHEVEFVMDKNAVCERVAMFVVTNYNISQAGTTSAPETNFSDKARAQLAALEDDDLSIDEIRAQEASRAEEIATAREMGMDADDGDSFMDNDEELVTGKLDESRIQRLKKLAVSSKSGNMVRRSDT